jgi:UDP-N-acetylglucosamine transferase subunit ALG13
VILVTVGTSEPFDRLLRALPDLGGEELVVQRGDSDLPMSGATVVEYLEFDEIRALVERARAVVCHAGVGTILVVLASGKRPIVMARRAQHGEAVDDHQVALGARLAEAGLVTLVEDAEQLARALETHGTEAMDERRPRPAPALVQELRDYLAEHTARGG